MAELRWVLLAAGLMVLLLIFLWGIRDKILSIFETSQKEGKFANSDKADNLDVQLTQEIESFALSNREGNATPGKEKSEINKSEPLLGAGSVDLDEEKVIDFGEPVYIHEEDLQKSPIESGAAANTSSPLNRSGAMEPKLTESAITEAKVSKPGVAEPKITDIKEAEKKLHHEPIETGKPETQASNTQSTIQQSEEGGVIVLYVRCPGGKVVSGKELKRAFAKQGLAYGDMKIFHRMVKDIKGSSSPLFGIANMIEPGTFSLETMDEMQTPGVTVFMQLPAVVDNLTAFNDMFKTSLEIAESINGELVTQNKNPVTPAWLEQMRTLLAAS